MADFDRKQVAHMLTVLGYSPVDDVMEETTARLNATVAALLDLDRVGATRAEPWPVTPPGGEASW